MKKKILFLSMYPAPYRVDLINRFPNEYDYSVFFETSTGDERKEEWFRDGNYNLLDTANGAKKFSNIKICDYDLVLLFEYSTKASIKLIANCKHNGIPYIINCDGVMMEKHGNFLRDIIKRCLIKGAAGYFASGENAKQYFLQYGANESKIHIHTFSELEENDILKQPLSAAEKAELRNKLGLPLEQKIAIAVGRFIPLKRYDALIRKWKNMPDDYTLLLIGGGSEEENYRGIIRDNGIKNVMINGYMPKEKLFDYYKAADIFVHPTSYDVWGLVVNEAMACGLPVVVSDHCVAGLELIQNGENGFRIPMGNDAEMCRRIVEIMSNSSLYEKMSRSVLTTIRPYTMSNMARVQINAVKEIIGE